jgi:hypothetical protein
MKTLGKFAALLAACALAACNDQPPASTAATPAPGNTAEGSTASNAAAPGQKPPQNPAGGTQGSTGGKYPAESAKTYPPTEISK